LRHKLDPAKRVDRDGYGAAVAVRFDRAWTSVRQWPGMRSEYSWIPPGGEPMRTAPDQIGVSFSSHKAVVYESGQRTIETDLAAGSVIVTGRDPITWLRVRETTEALEIYPDLDLLQRLAPGAARFEPLPPSRDATVLGIASILKRVHATGSTLSDVAASTLAHRLAGHLLDYYCGHRGHGTAPSRLDRGTVDWVAAFVDDELSGVLTLDRLAAVALLSPFHFARAFKATTGLATPPVRDVPPHAPCHDVARAVDGPGRSGRARGRPIQRQSLPAGVP
jgi:AraC-like DNA-binding protein